MQKKTQKKIYKSIKEDLFRSLTDRISEYDTGLNKIIELEKRVEDTIKVINNEKTSLKVIGRLLQLRINKVVF